MENQNSAENNKPVNGQFDIAVDASRVKEFGLSMIPFVPAPFTGNKAIYSYLRLAIYGTAAYLSFPKSKRLSYMFMGAAGVSLATSLSAKVLEK